MERMRKRREINGKSVGTWLRVTNVHTYLFFIFLPFPGTGTICSTLLFRFTGLHVLVALRGILICIEPLSITKAYQTHDKNNSISQSPHESSKGSPAHPIPVFSSKRTAWADFVKYQSCCSTQFPITNKHLQGRFSGLACLII